MTVTADPGTRSGPAAALREETLTNGPEAPLAPLPFGTVARVYPRRARASAFSARSVQRRANASMWSRSECDDICAATSRHIAAWRRHSAASSFGLIMMATSWLAMYSAGPLDALCRIHRADAAAIAPDFQVVPVEHLPRSF